MSPGSNGSASSTPNGAPPTNGPLPHAPSSSPPSHPTSDIAHPTSHSYYHLTERSPKSDWAEAVISKIIHDFSSADICLREIADAAHTTVEALTLWLARPEIAARTAALKTALRDKLEITLLNRSQSIMEACSTVITQFNHEEHNFPCDVSNARGLALLIANRHSALQACRILMRLQNLVHPRAPRAHLPAPSPNPNPNPLPNPNLSPSAPPPTSAPYDPSVLSALSPSPAADDLLARRAARFPHEPDAQPVSPPALSDPLPNPNLPPASPAQTNGTHKYPAGPVSNSASPSLHPSTPLPPHPTTPALPLFLPVLHTNGKSHKNGRHNPAPPHISRPP